jgi:hypothetical protein
MAKFLARMAHGEFFDEGLYQRRGNEEKIDCGLILRILSLSDTIRCTAHLSAIYWCFYQRRWYFTHYRRYTHLWCLFVAVRAHRAVLGGMGKAHI